MQGEGPDDLVLPPGQALTLQFADSLELQRWLAGLLEDSPFDVRVHSANADDLIRGGRHDSLLPFTTWTNGQVAYRPITPYRGGAHPQFWWETEGEHLDTDLPHMAINLRASGPNIVHSQAQGFSWEGLLERGIVSEDEEYPHSAQYWVVRLISLDYALLFPKDHSHIALQVENGGQDISITVRSALGATDAYRRQLAFEEKWAHLLAGSAALSQAELDEQTQKAEQAMRSLINQQLAKIEERP